MQQSSRRRQDTDADPMNASRERTASTGRSPQIDNDSIARRAYERYEARGREDGRDQDDWFEAERELRNGGTSPGNTQAD